MLAVVKASATAPFQMAVVWMATLSWTPPAISMKARALLKARSR